MDGTTFGSVPERGVDTFRVVVLDVRAEQASQVVFAQHDHVIEELATNRSHEAFRGPVLPGVEQRETHGRHDEEVHSRDRVPVIPQERVIHR